MTQLDYSTFNFILTYFISIWIFSYFGIVSRYYFPLFKMLKLLLLEHIRVQKITSLIFFFKFSFSGFYKFNAY